MILIVLLSRLKQMRRRLVLTTTGTVQRMQGLSRGWRRWKRSWSNKRFSSAKTDYHTYCRHQNTQYRFLTQTMTINGQIELYPIYFNCRFFTGIVNSFWQIIHSLVSQLIVDDPGKPIVYCWYPCQPIVYCWWPLPTDCSVLMTLANWLFIVDDPGRPTGQLHPQGRSDRECFSTANKPI